MFTQRQGLHPKGPPPAHLDSAILLNLAQQLPQLSDLGSVVRAAGHDKVEDVVVPVAKHGVEEACRARVGGVGRSESASQGHMK